MPYDDDYADLFPREPYSFMPVAYASEDDPWALDHLDDRHNKRYSDRIADWEGHNDRVVAALRRELRQYSYKPGVTMRIDPPPPRERRGILVSNLEPFNRQWVGVPVLILHAKVPDSRQDVDGPGVHWTQRPMQRKEVKVVSRHPVPEPVCELGYGWSREERREFFRNFWLEALRDFEDHELREWARFGGKLIDDPHAPRTPPKPPNPPGSPLLDLMPPDSFPGGKS